jgi:hypothetical protein
MSVYRAVYRRGPVLYPVDLLAHLREEAIPEAHTNIPVGSELVIVFETNGETVWRSGGWLGRALVAGRTSP